MGTFGRLPHPALSITSLSLAAGRPPYWAYAYPLAPWLGSTSVLQVAENLPAFRHTVLGGRDPALIVAGSGFWDISSWWANEGGWKPAWQWNHTHMARYVQALRALVLPSLAAAPTASLCPLPAPASPPYPPSPDAGSL